MTSRASMGELGGRAEALANLQMKIKLEELMVAITADKELAMAQLITHLEDDLFVPTADGFKSKVSLRSTAEQPLTPAEIELNTRKLERYSVSVQKAIEYVENLLEKAEAAFTWGEQLPADLPAKSADPKEAFVSLSQLRGFLQSYLDLFHVLVEDGKQEGVVEALSANEARQIMLDLEIALNDEIFGQEELVRHAVIALCAGGHVLLEGSTGVGKTELVKKLGALLNMDTARLQASADLTATDVLGDHENIGKIFTNLLLMDEINRLPPKVLNAFLEAMGEGTVTNGEKRYLPRPFVVFATQNRADSVGTGELSDANLDRFFFKIDVLPSKKEPLMRILKKTLFPKKKSSKPVADAQKVRALQKTVSEVPMEEKIIELIADIGVAIDPASLAPNEFVNKHVKSVSVVRGCESLGKAAKAHALLKGRATVNQLDIVAVAHAALRHHIVMNFDAASNNITPDTVIDEVLKQFMP